jgi:hypothetical protein
MPTPDAPAGAIASTRAPLARRPETARVLIGVSGPG